MEIIMMKQLHEYLAEKNTLTPAVWFSTQPFYHFQLINYNLFWVSDQNDGFATDFFFLDFQKAFNNLVHSESLIKVAEYGIYYELLSWIENFLGNKSHCITINGDISYFFPLKVVSCNGRS